MAHEYELPGKFQVRIEESNLMFARQIGPAELPDIEWLMGKMDEEYQRRGPLYLLMDISGGSTLSSEGRRYAAKRMVPGQFLASAIVGGSLAMRTVVNMVVRASALTSKDSYPTKFFAKEPEARAWLDALRKA